MHEIGFWDNGIPYDGSVPSWGHHLRGEGLASTHRKLHFRSSDDDNGFSPRDQPLLHVVEWAWRPAELRARRPAAPHARRGVQAPSRRFHLPHLRHPQRPKPSPGCASRPAPEAVGAVPVLRVPPSHPTSGRNRVPPLPELCGDVPCRRSGAEHVPRTPPCHSAIFHTRGRPTEEGDCSTGRRLYAACSNLDEQIGRCRRPRELGLTGDTQSSTAPTTARAAVPGLTGKVHHVRRIGGRPLIRGRATDVPRGRGRHPGQPGGLLPDRGVRVGGTAAPGLPGRRSWHWPPDPIRTAPCSAVTTAIGRRPPTTCCARPLQYISYGGARRRFDWPRPRNAAIWPRRPDPPPPSAGPLRTGCARCSTEAVDRRRKGDQAAR